MKNIKQIRESYDLITEKEENEEKKLVALVRAGLFDAKKLPALKKALDKSSDKMTAQERRMLLNLLDELMTQVISNQPVYQKVKQNLMKEEKSSGFPVDQTIPSVILLKRKAIRTFPNGQKVALYYAQSIDKYVSIPYNEIGLSEEIELNEWVGPAIKGAIAAGRAVGKSLAGKGKKVYDAYKAKRAAQAASQAKSAETAKKLATTRKKALADKAAKPGSKAAKETKARTVANRIRTAKERSKPGFLKRVGGRLAAGAAAVAGGLAGGGGGGSGGSSEPKYFTPMTSKIQANVTGPKREGGSDARSERERQASLRASKAMANESASLDLDGNLFEINSKASLKVRTLYESLNKKNKKKMIEMMKESNESLEKVISFAVRQ